MSAPRKLRVAVLFGGRSAEHEISLLSARNVVQALDRERFNPMLIGIDKNGRWLLQEEAVLLAAARDPRLARLEQSASSVSLVAHPGDRGEAALTIAGSASEAIDVVFPVLHGPMGEDGCIQGLLELAGVPYVGSGVLGSAVGMDKDVMKRLLDQAEIPIVPYETVRLGEWSRGREAILQRCSALVCPLFVKPANLGSSVGVTKVKDSSALATAIDAAFEYDTKVVIEQGIEGVREIECSVLGDDDPIASTPGEIVVDHPDGFYSYAAKYIDEHGATTRIPADLTSAQASAVQLLALRTFRTLEGSGLARVDFFMDKSGALYVNEINTLPGFTSISMYPKMWEASGIPPQELVARLIDLALARSDRRRKLKTSA
jgi:D-alanine-D-alanine ligase